MPFWRSEPNRDLAALSLVDFLDRLPDPAMVLDGGTTLAFLNDAMRQSWPIGDTMIGQDFWSSFPDLAEDQAAWKSRIAMQTGQPQSCVTLCLRTRKHHHARLIPLGRFLVLIATDYSNEQGLPPSP